MAKLSMKTSLIRAARALPSSIEDVKPGALLPGYVASVTPDAVFVRFLGSLTGRAGAPSPAFLIRSSPVHCLFILVESASSAALQAASVCLVCSKASSLLSLEALHCSCHDKCLLQLSVPACCHM